MLIAIAVGAQASSASYLRLIDTAAWTSDNTVRLSVWDPDDSKTHDWTSPACTSISNLISVEGVIAYFDTVGGMKYLHTVAYDPGDRKFHKWVSSPSSSYSILSINSGIVACINGAAGSVQAVAYDPGDRAWHPWTGPALGNVAGLTNVDGVVAFSLGVSKYAAAAAYDMGDKKWHDWLCGPSQMNDVGPIINHTGVVTFGINGKVVAYAYDSGDRAWHRWDQYNGTYGKLLNNECIVAFINGLSVYAPAYSPADNDWVLWTKATTFGISDLAIESGEVIYRTEGTYYRQTVGQAPRSRFVAVRSTCADSLGIRFSDNSMGAISSWQWTFGDGKASTERSPWHTYAKAGTYTVKLKVTGPCGTHTSSKSITIPVPTYTLKYTAGSGGSISGTATQTVKLGASGTLVSAVPAKGYHFVKWSDDVKMSARVDANVKNNIAVTATFSNRTACQNWVVYE